MSTVKIGSTYAVHTYNRGGEYWDNRGYYPTIEAARLEADKARKLGYQTYICKHEWTVNGGTFIVHVS